MSIQGMAFVRPGDVVVLSVETLDRETAKLIREKLNALTEETGEKFVLVDKDFDVTVVRPAPVPVAALTPLSRSVLGC